MHLSPSHRIIAKFTKRSKGCYFPLRLVITTTDAQATKKFSSSTFNFSFLLTTQRVSYVMHSIRYKTWLASKILDNEHSYITRKPRSVKHDHSDETNVYRGIMNVLPPVCVIKKKSESFGETQTPWNVHFCERNCECMQIWPSQTAVKNVEV